MSVPFGTFNAELIEALVRNRRTIEAKQIIPNHAARLIAEGGHKLSLLPFHFVFDAAGCAELATAGAALIGVQTKILDHLVETIGRDGVLEMFRAPDAMRRFVNWDELLNPQLLVGRFDILQCEDGYHFCEFNTDSCVAGAEMFEFMSDYLAELGICTLDARSPLRDLAAFIACVARQRDMLRIVILDWSVGGGSAGKGYLSFEYVRAYLARAVQPIPVFIADEKTYDPGWLTGQEASRTLVYRGFMMQEMDDGGVFLERLIRLGATVINTYESEIRTNKIWFALFHDQTIIEILSASDRQLIAKYIPYTRELDDGNASYFIERKDEYVFKEKQSFGGSGIWIGDETPAAQLQALFQNGGAAKWTAQRLLTPLQAMFPHDGSFRCEAHHVVFGLYHYGSRVNGMLLRASTRSRIVNGSSGRAKMAWAMCVNEDSKAELVSRLRGMI